MKATKIGKCVVCHAKVTEVKEFLPQLDLFHVVEPAPGSVALVTSEMRAAIIAWRDIPILCDTDKLNYTVKVVKDRPVAK